jgi:hypothetical protein
MVFVKIQKIFNDEISLEKTLSSNSEYFQILDTCSRCLGILFDLFPDAVTNVILSKQSLTQICKIVSVGTSANVISKANNHSENAFDSVLFPRLAIALALSCIKVFTYHHILLQRIIIACKIV